MGVVCCRRMEVCVVLKFNDSLPAGNPCDQTKMEAQDLKPGKQANII